MAKLRKIVKLRGKKVVVEDIENTVLKRVLESLLNNEVKRIDYVERYKEEYGENHSDVFNYTEQYLVGDKKSREKIKIEFYREYI